MGFFDEITKPFKNIGKELGKVGKDVGFDKWGPWAMMLLPFTPWGAALKGMQPEWMKGIMKTKFMNSAFGAAAKDAGIKYMTAVAMDKEHPEKVFKSSFLSNMALGYYKTGGDMDAFFGKTPTPAFADKIIEASPTTMGTTYPPKYAYSGQVMPHVSYKTPTPYMVGEMGTNVKGVPQLGIPDVMRAAPPTPVDWTGEHDVLNLDKLRPAMTYEASPAIEAMTIPGKDIHGPVTEAMMADAKAPLEGMGLQKRIKTKPGFWEKLPHGMEVGSPEYDEYFGIGEQQWDPMYLGKSAYDLMMTGGPTKEDLEREKRRKMEQFREDLMWRPDAPDYFDDFFLGNRGGIASLASGGRIGYQDGGPAGMSLEELKKQIFSKYMTTNYGDNQMAYDPEGAGPMTPMAPYPDDDFIFDEGTIGPNPSFADEFEGYTDLASGDPATDYRDMWEQYNDQIIRVGLPPISFEEFMELRGESGVEAGARGGRMGYQGGGSSFVDSELPSIDSPHMEYTPETMMELALSLARRRQPTGRMWEDVLKKSYFDVLRKLGGMENASLDELEEAYATTSTDAPYKARGGRMGYYGGGDLNAIPGGAISGPGTGTSDSIPAKLSNNEFVFTANAVKAAGGGDVNAGAQQLYGIMNALDPNSARINEPPVYS